jgi:hypothetical protein
MTPEVRKTLEFVRSLLTHGRSEVGYCMCGSPVSGHGMGDGHSPVDAFDYHAARALTEIEHHLKDLSAMPNFAWAEWVETQGIGD